MNEKIKEFARMSGLNVDGEESFSEFAEKTRLSCFAELIVRECAKICVEVGDANSDIYPEFGNGAYFSANRVKQHFGVEE